MDYPIADIAVASVSLAVAVIATVRAARHKKRAMGPETLAGYAKQAVAYGEQFGKTPAEKLEHAMHAARRLDAGDNGKRDWSDAQIRIAIEAHLKSQK